MLLFASIHQRRLRPRPPPETDRYSPVEPAASFMVSKDARARSTAAGSPAPARGAAGTCSRGASSGTDGGFGVVAGRPGARRVRAPGAVVDEPQAAAAPTATPSVRRHGLTSPRSARRRASHWTPRAAATSARPPARRAPVFL